MKLTVAYLAAFGSTAMAQGCSPLELIYARATTEPVGFGAAGGHLKTALQAKLPGSTAYAVQYPASMDLNGGGCKGAKDMINRIRTQSQKCPQQKFALGGHSQGGAVVTAGIPSIPKALLSKVVAVTMFGSPPCSDVPQVAGRCKSFCNKGDTICDSKGAMGNGGPRVKCGRGLKRSILELPTSNAVYPPVNETMFLGLNLFAQDNAFAGDNGCGSDEKGHAIKGGGTGMAAHMAYNRDGYYVNAAACFIAKNFRSAGGASAGGAEASDEGGESEPAAASPVKGKGFGKGKGKGKGFGGKLSKRVINNS